LRLDLTSRQWVVAFLIGTATVLAALFGWRAAAIGSTAAFDDRQSISETVTTEQQRIDVGLGVNADSREYARYLTDYGVAAELDNQAASLRADGDEAAAAGYRREADSLRRTATTRAVEAGVFGRYGIQDDLLRPSRTPRPFSVDDRARALQVEQATAIDSPGPLDPDDWAGQAEAIRDRILGLAVWSLMAVVALLLFTVGQVNSGRRAVFYAAMGLGLVALLVGAIGGFATDFHA
jgi:hypothetical protein